MRYRLRKGTRIRVIEDFREGGSATGTMGSFECYTGEYGWLLCIAGGSIERESLDLPEGYIEWDLESDDFPKVNCGIKVPVPSFTLDDGSFISGGECDWDAVSLIVFYKLCQEYQWILGKLGTSEDQIPTLEQLFERRPS